MNEIQVFSNAEFGEMRTIEEKGKTLFCGTDVAKALGYGSNHKQNCNCRNKGTSSANYGKSAAAK